MATTINGSAGVITNSGAVYDGLQLRTAVASTSGTSIDFTGIPSWVKRITVMLSGVSTSGTSVVEVRLGDSGGIETTGYIGTATGTAGAGLASSNLSTGIPFDISGSATYIKSGNLYLTNLTGNTWTFSATFSDSSAARANHVSGSKTLTDVLTQLRITTVNGTDTFDAGSINIMYE